MVLPSLWCTQYHQKYSAVRADTAVLFLARSRDSSAQLLDINTTSGCSQTTDTHMAFGGSTGHGHQHSPLLWQDHVFPHGHWMQHRPDITKAPGGSTGHSHHYSPWISTWFWVTARTTDIHMALGGCTDCTSHCLRWHPRIHTSACSSPKSHLQFHLSPQHRKLSAALSLPSFYHILAHHSDSSLEVSGCLQPSLCLENGRICLY